MLVLVALVAATVSGGARTDTGSGLYGAVVRWPTMPVCRAGQPCSAPAKFVLLRFSAPGLTRAARTDSHGHYRIALPPGPYAVSVTPRPAIGRGLEPRHVLVPAARYARANFTIDTGIR